MSDGAPKTRDSLAGALSFAAIEHGALAVVAFDGDGTVRLFNRAAAVLWGLAPEQVIGRSVFAIAPFDGDLPAYVDDRRVPRERSLARGDGSLRWVTSSVSEVTLDGVSYFVETLADVTEARARDHEERQRMEIYRKFVEESTAGFGQADKHARLTRCNARLEAMLGYGPGELLGLSVVNDLAYPEDRDVVAARQVSRRLREPPAYEHRMRRKDGQPVWVQILSGRLNDVGGEYQGSFALLTDITERKLADDELTFRGEIVEAMAEGVNLVRVSDGVLVYTNPAFDRMLGYERGELLGRHISAINAPEEVDGAEIARRIIAHLHAEGTWRGEIRNARKDGSVVHCSGSVSEFRHATHGPVWLSLHEDITERTLAAARLELALETTFLGVWSWDVARGELIWDARTFRLHGLPPAEVAPSFDDWRSRVHPEDVAAFDAGLARALAGEKLDTEYRIVWPDGTVHHRRALARAVLDASGRAVQVIGTNFDITARKQSELVLRQATRAAEEASRAKSRFLTRMSHEIRTPLNAVIGAADLLEGEALTEDGREYARLLRQGGASLATLVGNILEFAAVESGRIASTTNAFRPAAVVCRVVETLRPLAIGRPLRLAWTVSPRVPDALHGDERHIWQVLLNLVGNALKFTAEGAVDVGVDFEPPGLLRLTVRDTGPGIPPEIQADLFDPDRVRVRATSQEQGSGLGLTICHALVELMGGTLGFTTNAEGSTFTVAVPVSLPGAPVSAPDLLLPPPGLRVLVAEDDPVSARVLTRLLVRLGVERIVVAENGLVAVNRAHADAFDLLLLDMHMPVLTGLEALDRIRRDEHHGGRPPVRAVACTADAFAEDRERWRQAGADHFLAKPVSLESLRRLLVGLFPPPPKSA